MTREQWEKGCSISGVQLPPKTNLWAIEILFKWYDGTGVPQNDLQRWYIFNQCWPEVRNFRETIFTHGFFLEKSPGRGEIIFPADFRKIYIDIQKSFKETV